MGTRRMTEHGAPSAGALRRRGSKGKDPFERHDLKAIDEMQAVGVTTVPARTSGPQRKSRLRNRSAAATAGDTGTSAGSQGSAAAGARLAGGSITSSSSSRNHQDQISEQDLDGVDRRAICEDILTGGHVQTFVDFFYLTHRPAPVQDATDPGEGSAEVNVPKREMLFIRDNLVAAESARRRGDTAAVYRAYNSLAQYYQEMNDPKTGVYFHEKCLEISRLTADRGGEMSANHRLGVAYEKMGDVVAATNYHERHQELAIAVDIQDEQKEANKSLINVYRKFAEERESEGLYKESIEFWAKSLEAARSAGDQAALGQACYRLGKAYTELEDPTRAVNYLEDFQSISTELDDLEGQGKAYEALAAVHQQSLGDDDKALSLLQSYLDVASKTQNVGAQEAACSNLGVLHSRRRQHAKAKDMFERNFVISRKMVNARQGGATTALVDMSRAFLGIAAGNEMAEDYMNAVASDVGALLDWKSNRIRPSPAANKRM
ncbi:unnamed protein product [Ectocarpus sp. 13 AM-2016]